MVKCLPLIALLLTCLVSCASIDEVVEGRLECQYFGQTDQTLAIRAQDAELTRLVDMNFRISPFVPTNLSCQQWLDLLPDRTFAQRKWHVRPTLSKAGNREGRLIDADRSALYRSCSRSPLCRVRFPYNLGLWRLREFLRSKPPSAFGLHEELCQQPIAQSALQRIPLEGIEVLGTRELQDVSVFASPPDGYPEQVVRLIEGMQGGTIFISTMQIVQSEVEKIALALAEKPFVTAYLLFDAALATEGHRTIDWLDYATDRFHFVPIAPRPDRPAFYHLKGAAEVGGGDRFLFTSLNLTDNTDAQILDLGFTAKGKDAATALAGVFSQEVEKACREPAYLECTLSARASPKAPLRHELRAALAESCRNFYDSDLPRRFARIEDRLFLTTDRVDIVDVIEQLVKHASSSVRAYTHRLDSWPVLFALEQARERGVQVSAFAGRKGDHPIWETPKLIPLLKAFSGDPESDPHAKYILIDDRLAFWGTGNLTKNGLHDAAEYFFLTDHPLLLDTLRRYAGFCEGSAERPSPKSSQSKP